MPRKITGATAVPQQTKTSYSRAGGITQTVKNRYTTEAEATAAGFALFNQGYDFDITPGPGGTFDLSASVNAPLYGGSNPNVALNDVWEYQPNMVEKDFLDAENGLSLGMSSDQMQDVRTKVDTVKPDKTGFTTNQLTAFSLMSAGIRSTRTFAPVIRHTLLVRRDYTLKLALNNVGNVITVANFQATEGVPNTLLFNLPTNSNPSRGDGLVLKYGWYKKAPVITQVGGGKWQLVKEWEWGLWSTDLYSFI